MSAPDPLVFGDWPATPMERGGLPDRARPVHRVEWSGGGCWMCEGGAG